VSLKLVFGIFIFVALGFSFKSYNEINTDFRAYYVAGKRIVAKTFQTSFDDPLLISGVAKITSRQSMYNSFESTPFKYPIITSYLFSPFSFFNYKLGSLVWFFACQTALVLSLFLLRNYFVDQFKISNEKMNKVIFLTYIAMFRFYLYDMKNLQVNFFILLGFVIFVVSENDWLKATFLALVISFKVFPFVLFLFLAVEKKWKLMGKTVIVGIFFLLVPLISYQFSFLSLMDEMKHYLQFMSGGQHLFPADPSYIHPSIDSLIVRIFMIFPDIKPSCINLFSLSPQVTWVIILLVKMIIIAMIVLIHFHFKNKLQDKVSDDVRVYLFSSLYFVYSLFINPLAWKHAYVGLTPLLLYIFHYGFKQSRVLTVASLFLLIFTSKGVVGNYYEVVGHLAPVLWGTLLLMFISLRLTIARASVF